MEGVRADKEEAQGGLKVFPANLPEKARNQEGPKNIPTSS